MPNAIGIASYRANIGEVAERLRIGVIARAEQRVAGKLQILRPLQRVAAAPGMEMNVCWNPAIWIRRGADCAELEAATLVRRPNHGAGKPGSYRCDIRRSRPFDRHK